MGYKHLTFDKDTTFLVTGAAGFIGSNLCEAILYMGYKVVGLDNLSTGKKENLSDFSDNPLFSFIEGDIRDLATCMKVCEGIDYVLHQAAWGSVPRSLEHPLLYEEINIKGTLNMLEAARQNKVKRFVYASSSSVYGDEPTLPKKEGREGNLLSPYAVTKRVNEEYAKQYSMHYGLETVGLRYFNVFGKRQDPNGPYAAVIPKFIYRIIEGKSLNVYGDGNQTRDFTHIENVIDANVKACAVEGFIDDGIFNIACGNSNSIMDLIKSIEKITFQESNVRHCEERKGDVSHSLANIDKAKSLLSYTPQISFLIGLQKTIMYNRNNS